MPNGWEIANRIHNGQSRGKIRLACVEQCRFHRNRITDPTLGLS